MWLELGQTVQQNLVQQKIEAKEAQYPQEQGARTKRKKRYYTPLGEMVLKRRVYLTETGLKIKGERYLTNNQTRIDYKRYLKEGLMIGSGVVESSNRRVVTQRLKQAPNARRLS